MFRAMRSAEVLEQIQKSDARARAFLDGLDAKARLIEQNGGVFKMEQVAEYLGITPQAVNKRRALRQLVGLTFRKRGYVFPAWQFTDRGAVPGLELSRPLPIMMNGCKMCFSSVRTPGWEAGGRLTFFAKGRYRKCSTRPESSDSTELHES